MIMDWLLDRMDRVTAWADTTLKFGFVFPGMVAGMLIAMIPAVVVDWIRGADAELSLMMLLLLAALTVAVSMFSGMVLWMLALSGMSYWFTFFVISYLVLFLIGCWIHKVQTKENKPEVEDDQPPTQN